MSSTSVHSNERRKTNKRIAAGQTIADENGKIDVPPTASKQGPSILEVRSGDNMEIAVEDGELHRDGTLTSKNGILIASYDEKVFRDAEKRAQEKGAKEADKGSDR